MQNPTIFQRLTNVFSAQNKMATRQVTAAQAKAEPEVIYKTKNKEEYETKKLELRQQKFLANQWTMAQADLSNRSLAGLNEVKMMYRDADLMDTFPEIGSALDIVSEESTFIKPNGMMVNVSSKSERIKPILEDLLVNRLSIHTTLPMICRAMCKYGNNFMLLNVNMEKGVMGWKQLPVYEVERYENGMHNPYANAYTKLSAKDNADLGDTKFVWVGANEYIPYFNWQVAHFRLLYDSLFLPFGCSFLHKARRHFRMLSMMEDMMLIYRLERSIERRVFKINVGAIDEADVPAYVQMMANNFKRREIVDPMTGQLDLKKNLLNVSEDYFIPVRDDNAPNPIDTLQGAQNMTAMDDIKFIQNKVMAALRVPKTFLNFEETQGDGKNLSLLDVRFTRTINRVQQALIMELNKVCIIHLYLLGFVDELTNFTLTMNNPSSQAEMLELENLAKKITTAKDAVVDGGNGIPIMSMTRAWKNIMGWSDKEIENNLEELRLEKALAAELEKTEQIIKRTRVFDTVDNIYGEPGADYVSEQDGEGEEGPDGPGGIGGGIGGGFGGGEFDFGSEGGDEEIGEEGEMSMDDAASGEEGMEPEPGLGESKMSRMLKKVLNEQKRVSQDIWERSKHYQKMLSERVEKYEHEKNTKCDNIPLYDKNFVVNEELNHISKRLGDIIDKSDDSE